MTFIRREAVVPAAPLEIGETFAAVMRHVFLWMFVGLLVTAVTSVAMVFTPLNFILAFILENTLIFYGLLIGELVMVVLLSARITKLSIGAARFWFLAYAALNGVTLSIIFLVYPMSSILLAFFATAGLFGAMALIGYTTKKDLSSWRGYLLMGLIGLLIASVANIFFASSTLDWILTYAGILIFLALTIYDMNRIKRTLSQALANRDETTIARLGILGALRLYLDFINLFIRLLRIFGSKGKRR